MTLFGFTNTLFRKTSLLSMMLISIVFFTCRQGAQVGVAELDYPVTKRGDDVDVYHGVSVPDPYRWFEEMESNEVRDWVQSQDSVARAFIQQIPSFNPLQKRVAELDAYGKAGDFVKRGDFYFYIETTPAKPQSMLFAERVSTGERKALVDPNLLSNDGSVAIVDYSPSPSGKFVAYALVDGPSRYFDWHLVNVDKGEELADTVEAAMLVTGSAAFRNPWPSDEAGFYYKRYARIDRENSATPPQELGLYYHQLGQPQSADALVYERKDAETIRFDGMVSDDGKYLIIREYRGRDDGDAIYLKKLGAADGEVQPLIAEENASFAFLGNQGDRLWFLTDHAAAKQRIIEVNVERPAPHHWKELVPEATETLDQAFVFGNRFLLAYLKDAATFVRIHETDGRLVHEVDIPVGLVWNMHMRYWSGFTGGRDDDVAYVRNLGITSAGSIYRLDMRTGELAMQKRAATPFPLEDYVTKQVFYQSKDGTRVPMFITHKKGIALNGQHPTLLWAYGAHGFTAQPFFNSKYATFLEMGGIHAMPNIRGGGAYGLNWYEAGSRANKINTVDDIIAAADWLVREKYTSASKLVMDGNSAGATVVGGALTRRPDMFGAVLLEVPIADMLRAINFKGGTGWVSTFGSPEIKEEFHALYSYSPYHNVAEDVCYPPVFIAAGDKDVTAVPMHAYKLTAMLQHAQQNCREVNPVLLRVDWGTDHGQNKPEPNRQAERVAELAFLSYTLGMSDSRR